MRMDEIISVPFLVLLYIAMWVVLWVTRDRNYKAPKAKPLQWRKKEVPEGFGLF